MAKVINIVGSCSNVGKTFVMEGIIKELKARNYKIATIKHDVHGFDIDHEGKDTYKHRQAGADTVIISSKNRYAKIKELKEEMNLNEIIKDIHSENDIILVEGYKRSSLRKIEIYRDKISKSIISPKEKLVAIASDIPFNYGDIAVINKSNFKELADLIEKEEDYKIEN
ncbi:MULTISPECIES: molybdopterin-guanine dinucleotide biosynthesis protein B [unclassified Romboutsia]|uniref:molybdopterin-guanine dinucleotide biosynthesis protein B n=1 Tax=unclassified Romboutsia TaxID=2626894 RepID=UPI0008234D5A|nr:molybdopterin-guanine dinucleotide biosynthesis protein B [Romboutsia sp. Marseille-P6047]SCH74491.1 Molybdopterin-guanine dinucleotide biosynthesis protein B [uncultured Clostridium sp.]